MKKLLFILAAFCYTVLNGQNVFTVPEGTTISDDRNVFGSPVITLKNMDLINNNYNSPICVRFSGNANSTMAGSGNFVGWPHIATIEIAKTNNARVTLMNSFHMHARVIFASGLLDLNGKVLCLFTSGEIVGESENSRIIGPSGGYVQYKQHPHTTVGGWSTGVTYGYFDSVTCWVRRGHVTHTGNLGTGSGIQRYFQIAEVESEAQIPTISVRMKYLESELNGLNENDLVFWSSPDMVNWTNNGFTTRNTADNYLELSNITNFQDKYFTLASAGSPRPITWAPLKIKTIIVPGKETISTKWKTWPNPADKIVWIDITSTLASYATTSIFDSKGSLIRTQTDHLIESTNRLKIDVKNLAPGIYYVNTNWNGGREKRSSRFVKL